MAIDDAEKRNFNTILKAAENGELIAMECRERASGQRVLVLCARSPTLAVVHALAEAAGMKPVLVPIDEGTDGGCAEGEGVTMPDRIPREPDMDELRDAAEERAYWRAVRGGCRCGTDLPGRCPGPVNCPYSGVDVEDEDDA